MATRTQLERVLLDQDIPASASALAGAPAVPVTANTTNMYITNRLTFFEELVIAITDGFAASGRGFETDAHFASQACSLARAISFERDKYSNL